MMSKRQADRAALRIKSAYGWARKKADAVEAAIHDPEITDDDFDALAWLDGTPRDSDAWEIVEEAARLRSIEKAQREKFPAYENLFTEGRIYGMACALEALSGQAEAWQGCTWVEFIDAFADDNYTAGRRNEE